MASALVIAIYPFSPTFQAGKLEATVLDVGQGDSVLVVSPRGHTLLIDGGGAFAGFPGRSERNGVDPGEEAVSPYLWSRGFQRLFSSERLKAYRESFHELKGNQQVCATTVGLSQNMLLADRGDMDHIIEAVRKIQAHSATLAKAT